MPKKKNVVDAAGANQNDRFIYVLMVVLLAEIAAVGLLHGVQKYYSYAGYMDTIAASAGWIGLACVALGAAGMAAWCVTGKRQMSWAGTLLLLAAACAGCIHMYYTDGVTMAYALVIAAGLLYLAGQIYPPESVALAGLSAVAAVCYYGISKYAGARIWNSYTAPLAIALVAVLAVALVMTVAAGRKDGVLALGAARMRLWQKREAQFLLYLSCVVWAALLALVFLLGATFAWYCVLVALLVIFVLAVWFTIKLM